MMEFHDIDALIEAATASELNNSAKKNSQVAKHILLTKIKQHRKGVAGQLKIAVSGFVVSLFALIWFFSLGELSLTGAALLACWSGGAAAYAIYLARKKYATESALMELSSSLFQHCRNEVTSRIKIIKVLGPIMLIEATALVLFSIFKGTGIPQGLPVFLGLSALFASFVFYQYLSVLPRLTHELKLLNDGVR